MTNLPEVIGFNNQGTLEHCSLIIALEYQKVSFWRLTLMVVSYL